MLLNVKDLTISFRDNQNKKHTVVHGINFHLKQGESLGLVGESGSGKSVTALSIMGLLPQTAVFGSRSQILLNGENTLAMADKTLRALRGKTVGYIFQEPMTALNPLQTVGQQVAEVIRTHTDLSKRAIIERVHELFEKVQLHNFKDRYNAYPHQLSGGQRQRIMIAMAIACNPTLLVADEPTTALDVTVQAEIVSLLKELIANSNMALLLISHNLPMVKKLADRMLIMQNGKFIEEGSCTEIFNNPQHDYTKLLLTSLPNKGPKPLSDEVSDVLEAKNIQVDFTSKPIWFWQKPHVFQAVKQFDCSLKKGETLGVVGESGSGKTTAALALLSLLPHRGRTVFIGTNVEDLVKKDARKVRKNLQIIFQDPFGSLNPRFSIEQVISEGLRIHEKDLTNDQRIAKVKKALRDVSLPENFIYRYPHELSGGQRQRIAIARSLILDPDVLILDEPTSALDHSTQAEVLALLQKLQTERQFSYIIISHDLAVIRAMSHRILVMKDGKIIEHGNNHAIITTPQSPYTQKLIDSAMNL